MTHNSTNGHAGAGGGKVVVTGGAGFIGSHLVDLLLAGGSEVHVVDNLASGRRERVPDAASFHLIDVSDQPALLEFAREHGPFDRWFHLAAQADVRVSVDDPVGDARTNVLGTICVLEAAKLHDAQVVFASTGGAIYGEAGIPTPEGAEERPESPYGSAKLAAEKYVATYGRLYGHPHAIVRYANVYGPRQDPHGEAGVVAIFGGRILRRESARIFGDGTQTRDYVFVGDVVEATLRAGDVAREAGAREVPVYNVGTGRETSVLELWRTMTGADGVDLGWEFEPARAGELARSALDASRARTALAVAIDTPLEDGLGRTLEWLREDG
jgi:UDP-glucose 4-epimerase